MPRKRKGNPVHGWVVFDKPLTMGSTQAVGKIRWLFQAQKAGHAGTLDPLATGVLPIALGEATKTVPFMMDADKEYEFTVTWGANTDTWDAEGAITATSDVRPTEAAIKAVLPEFTGAIEQVPPRYSAIKVDGQRSYDLARSGEVVALKSRRVDIHGLEIMDATEDSLSLRVHCGKGTYIRSLARDLAARLGTCGHVTHLRRTRVGVFDETRAFSLDALEKLAYEGRVLEGLLPVETALDDIPVYAATETQTRDLKHGRAIVLPNSLFPSDPIVSDTAEDPYWVLVMGDDKAVALCDARGGKLSPKRVFNM